VHVAQSCVDTALSGNGVRSGWEKLGDASSFETSLRQTEGGSETCTTSSDDDGVVFVINDGVVANK
jgi:hypothetical protein